MAQVIKEREGKAVDAKCHSMTASFVRERHKTDSSVPVCAYYEVSWPQSYSKALL